MSNLTLIGSREAAKICRLSHSHFIRLVNSGAIPSVEKLPGVRGAFIFDRAEIEALAKKGAAA